MIWRFSKNKKRRMENISSDDIVAIIASTNNIGDDYSAEVSDHGTAEQKKGGFGMDIMMRTSVDKESMI